MTIPKYIEIDFPALTAKEIIRDNKLGKGKFLYNISWYSDDPFFTNQKCRVGKRNISTTLTAFGKTHSEAKEIVKENMLNFPELIYFVRVFFEKYKEYPFHGKWAWVDSKTSGGGLVYAGRFGRGGASLDWLGPAGAGSRVGCSFSAVAEGRQGRDVRVDELELRVTALEDWKKHVINAWNNTK